MKSSHLEKVEHLKKTRALNNGQLKRAEFRQSFLLSKLIPILNNRFARHRTSLSFDTFWHGKKENWID